MTTLKIKNFQSHHDTELDIKQNAINVIVGESDSGKSAIFRAFELLICNRPSGDKYRTHNTKKTEVEYGGVKRVKSASISQYEIDGEIYKALRTDVPRQVTEKLRLSSINFRPQHSAYYMLTETPGQRARAMNELADLGLIDYTASALKGQERLNSQQITAKTADLESKQKQVDALSWATAADKDLELIERHQYAMEVLIAEIVPLSNLVTQLLDLETKLASFPDLDTEQFDHYIDWLKKNDCSELEKKLDKLAEYEEDLRLCPDPSQDIDKISSIQIVDYSGLETALTKLAEIESRSWPDESWITELKEIEEMFTTMQALYDKVDTMESLIGELDDVMARFNNKEVEEAAAIEEMNRLLAEAGVCPLCGCEIKAEETIEEAKGEDEGTDSL